MTDKAPYPKEAAEAAGWRHSREHDGWVHEAERDDANRHKVLHRPEDACELQSIPYTPHPDIDDVLSTIKF